MAIKFTSVDYDILQMTRRKNVHKKKKTKQKQRAQKKFKMNK